MGFNKHSSAESQSKKAEGETMQITKPHEINCTEKQLQQPNKYNICEKESTNGDNESTDYTAIDSQGHQQPTLKEKQGITFNTGNLVTIWNFKPSVWSSNSDTANVIALAKRMGLLISHDDIIDIDVYIDSQNSHVYEVYFHSKHVKEAFLEKSHILKELPETKLVVIY